jgi:hypothetical protein
VTVVCCWLSCSVIGYRSRLLAPVLWFYCYQITGFQIFRLSAPDEVDSRNASCALNVISMFILHLYWWRSSYQNVKSIGGVMVSMLASSEAHCGFESRSDQTKNIKLILVDSSRKHTSLRRKIKDWLARNQDNVTEWGDMSIHRLFFQ